VRRPRVVVTGAGLVCGAGGSPADVLAAVQAGRSAIAPIRAWDASGWPAGVAAEIPDYDPVTLGGDRKLVKLIRRTDVLGLAAASQAVTESCLAVTRSALDADAAADFGERTGVYVGCGGGAYANQHDFFPLLARDGGGLDRFGRDLGATVNPMWLLRSLPNNVLCYVGIRHGLKGPNACITNHAVSGTLALVEALEAVRAGTCERALAVAHDAPVEPQAVLYYQRLGLLSGDTVRPFDADRDGTVLGEGAGGLVLETEASAAARGARVLGEVLGGALTGEAEGLLRVRADGEGLVAAIEGALADADVPPAAVGMIVAHGNGTRTGDASEALALSRVFGPAPPPVTAFKWAFGHLIGAAGLVEAVVGLAALAAGTVPGVATLARLDPALAGLPVTATARAPRSDVALLLARGFAGTNAAVVLRAARA
jgi:3-oxoacyl-[acyl-carrier-protein] synthase-1